MKAYYIPSTPSDVHKNIIKVKIVKGCSSMHTKLATVSTRHSLGHLHYMHALCSAS